MCGTLGRVYFSSSLKLVEVFLQLVDAFDNLFVLEQHDLPKLEHKVFGDVIQDRGHFVIEGLSWQLVCHAVQN